MKLKYLLTVCLCMVFTPFTMADNEKDLINQALDTFKKGNRIQAATLLEQACNSGNAEGCSYLGQFYRSFGSGTEKDYIKAAKLYEKACNSGNARGCNNLGASYAKGQGVKQDYTKAVKLYEQSCNNGFFATACFNLGLLYKQGKGVKKDVATAKKYFRKSCDLGDKLGCSLSK